MSEDKNLDPINENLMDGENKPQIEDEKSNEPKKPNNIKTIAIAAVIGVLCLGVGFTTGKDAGRKLPATHKNYGSKVVATVGDTKFTEKDLRKRMEPLFYIKGKQQLSHDEITAFELSMTDYMTTTEVLYLAGKEAKIEASKEEVEQEYAGLMSSIAQTFALEEADFLKACNLTKVEIEKDLEKEVIASKYMGQASEVSDKDVKKYYDENQDEFLKVRASHILISNTDEEGNELDDKEKAKNKKQAEEVLKKAQAGVDFEELAKQYSVDGSASNGGDLDFFPRGQMVEPFEKAAFSLKVGDITNEIVETQFGYHIIKKTDEKKEDFETVQEDLKMNLSYEKQNTLLDDLMKKYNVDVKIK